MHYRYWHFHPHSKLAPQSLPAASLVLSLRSCLVCCHGEHRRQLHRELPARIGGMRWCPFIWRGLFSHPMSQTSWASSAAFQVRPAMRRCVVYRPDGSWPRPRRRRARAICGHHPELSNIWEHHHWQELLGQHLVSLVCPGRVSRLARTIQHEGRTKGAIQHADHHCSFLPSPRQRSGVCGHVQTHLPASKQSPLRWLHLILSRWGVRLSRKSGPLCAELYAWPCGWHAGTPLDSVAQIWEETNHGPIRPRDWLSLHHGPRSNNRIQFMERAEEQVHLPGGPLEGWPEGKVKEALHNYYYRGRQEAKTIEYWPLTLKSFVAWFLNNILMKMLPTMRRCASTPSPGLGVPRLENLWAQKQFCSPSPSARSHRLIDKISCLPYPSIVVAEHLDFFKAEPITKFKPSVFDDGMLQRMDASFLKAFLNPSVPWPFMIMCLLLRPCCNISVACLLFLWHALPCVNL